MNHRIRQLALLAPVAFAAIAGAQSQLAGVPDFSQKNSPLWRNYCAPTSGADVVYYLSQTYPSLRQGFPWGPGAAADAGVNGIIGFPPMPAVGSISGLMGTTTARGTTLLNCANGLDAYLEANDGDAGVTWNTAAVLAAGFPAPAGQNFFTACQQAIDNGGVVILAISWPAGAPGGYDLPDGYVPYDDLYSPMGHAVAMTGYNIAAFPPTISINDPANNPMNAHNWLGENLAMAIAGLPNSLSFVIGGQVANVYGAAISSPVVHRAGFNRGIGTDFAEGANGVDDTIDGGFVTAGYIENPFMMGNDILVAKYDREGSPEWAVRYGGPGDDVGYSVQQTRDGGYIIGAETQSMGPTMNLAMLRLDPRGNFMWAWVYDGDASDEDMIYRRSSGVGVQETIEGTYLLTGRKLMIDMPAPGQMGVVIHAAPFGNPIWMFGYGDPRQFAGKVSFTDVKTHYLDFIYVCGTESSVLPDGNPNVADPVLLILRPDGQPVFFRNYSALGPGQYDIERGTGDGLDILADGSIIIDGRTDLMQSNAENLQVFRTDPLGMPLWNRVFPAKGPAYRSILEDWAGTVVLGGWSAEPDGTVPTSMLMVLDPVMGLPAFAHGFGLLDRASGAAPAAGNTATDAGYILAGTINIASPPGLNSDNIELIKTDAAGDGPCRQTELQRNPNEQPLIPEDIPPYIRHLPEAMFWEAGYSRMDLNSADFCCPPCVADFNEDGGVDGSDVGAFFDMWEAGRPCSDVNRDGGVDGSDVGFFFQYWEAGGC